ncbi:guanine nucleotide binding protein, alpha subunit [Gorgonomyces haynaldii]|nr:guanine nucleotide binding protein, alpha subunit [Gorgonomyces haynaldii]
MSNPQKIGRGLSQSVPILEDAPSSTQLSRKELRQRNAAIEKELARERTRIRKEKHLLILLLGPGDAGKSTVLKQFVLLHGQGFTESELEHYKLVIHSNIINNMKVLLKGRSLHGYPISHSAQLNVKMTVDLMKLLPEQMISQETWDRIQIAWQDPAVQEAYKTRELIPGFIDNYDYFYNKMDKIIQPEYVPSDDDILMCRQTSDLVTETFVDVGEKLINIIDVAGQEDKRMKWAPLFEKNVSAIIYVLSCVSYCQMMEENTSKNKLLDAFELYDQLVQHPILKPKNFIVFLNKVDLLPNRLAAYAPQSFLPDYVGILSHSRSEGS